MLMKTLLTAISESKMQTVYGTELHTKHGVIYISGGRLM